jgi:hypothetical protein
LLAETYLKLKKELLSTSEAFGKLSNSSSELLQTFSKFGKKTQNIFEDVENLTKGISELTSNAMGGQVLTNIANGILKASQELEKSFEKMRSEYTLASGQSANWGTQMREAMQDASNNISKFGVSTKDAALVVNSSLNMMQGDFDTANSRFNQITQDQLQNKEAVMTNIALLQQFGVSAQQTAKSTDIFYERIRITTGAAADFTQSMKDASDKVAETTLEISNFGFSMSETAAIMQRGSDIALVFGEQSLEKLAAQASRTRIEFDTLVSVAEKFDTFDSAATHVGKLNALLGADYLGVTEMMFSEPTERVRLLSGAFEEAGLTAESLQGVSEAEKNYTLMTIQSTLGLKNKNDALKFLNADEFERGIMLQKQQDDAIKQAEAQEKLNQLLFDAMPAMEKFANALKNLASMMQPVLELLNTFISFGADVVNFFGSLTKGTEEWAKTLLGLVGLIAFLGLSYMGLMMMRKGALAALSKMGALSGVIKEAGEKAAELPGPLNKASDGIGQAGNAAKTSWQSMLAFGAAILMIGAGIGIAAFGLSYLVDAFRGLGDAAVPAAWGIAALSASFVLFVAIMGLLVYSGVGKISAAIFLALGASALMFGIGIGIAAASFALLVSSLKDAGAMLVVIFTAFTMTSMTHLLGIAIGITAIGVALAGLALAGIGTTIGGAFSSLIGGITGTKSDPLSILLQLSQLDDTKFLNIASSINQLVTSLNTKVNTDLLDVLTELQSTLTIMTTISAINPIAAALFSGAITTKPSTGSGATNETVEMTVKNVPVIIKIDDVTGINGHIENITLNVLKKYSVVTR